MRSVTISTACFALPDPGEDTSHITVAGNLRKALGMIEEAMLVDAGDFQDAMAEDALILQVVNREYSCRIGEEGVIAIDGF